MSKYATLVQNIFLFGISTVATKLLTFFLVPIYTYYMTTEQFGTSDMGITVVSVLTPLLTFSVSDGVLRFVLDDSKNSKIYISLGFWISVLSCAIVAIALPLLDLPIFGGLGEYKLLFWMVYLSVTFSGYFSSVARALNQIKLIAIASVVQSFVTSGLAVLLIALMGTGVEGFLVSTISGGIVGALTYLFFGRHYRFIRFGGFHAQESSKLRLLLVYSLPLVPNTLFLWVNSSINRVIITGFIGVAASGLFAAASKIPNLLSTVYGIFFQAWNLSAFQEFKSANRSKFYSSIYKILFNLMSACTALLILTCKWIALLWLQKDFFSSWPLMPVLLLALFLSVLSSFYGTVYTASMKTKYLFLTTMVGAAVGVIGALTLIGTAGLWGVCFSMVLANFVMWILRAWDSRRIVVIRLNLTNLITVIFLLFMETAAIQIFSRSGDGFLYWVSFGSAALCCLTILIINSVNILPGLQKMLSIGKTRVHRSNISKK